MPLLHRCNYNGELEGSTWLLICCLTALKAISKLCLFIFHLGEMGNVGEKGWENEKGRLGKFRFGLHAPLPYFQTNNTQTVSNHNSWSPLASCLPSNAIKPFCLEYRALSCPTVDLRTYKKRLTPFSSRSNGETWRFSWKSRVIARAHCVHRRNVSGFSKLR